MLVGCVFVPVGRVYATETESTEEGDSPLWNESIFEKYKKVLIKKGFELKEYYVMFLYGVDCTVPRIATSDSPIYIGYDHPNTTTGMHLDTLNGTVMYVYTPKYSSGTLSSFTSYTCSAGSWCNGNMAGTVCDSSRLIYYSNYDIPEMLYDTVAKVYYSSGNLYLYRKSVIGKDDSSTSTGDTDTSGSSGTSSGSSTDTGILTQILSSVGSVVASMEKDSEKSEKYFNALIEEQGNNVGAVVSAIGEAVGSVTASMEKDSEKNEQYFNALIEEQGNNVGTVVSSIEKEGEKTAKYFEALIEEQGKNVGTVVSSIEKEGEKTAKYFEALIEEQGENVGTLISTIEKEGEKTAKYFEEAHPILSGILGGVENIVDVIKDGASKITDGIIGGVKSIFIPEDGYIEKKIKEMQKEFDSMGVVVYDMSVLFGKSSPIEDITVEIKGTRVVIFDSASLEYALDKFRPIIRGFFMLLLVFYNANQYLGFIGQMGVSVSGFVGVVNGARGKGGNNE